MWKQICFSLFLVYMISCVSAACPSCWRTKTWCTHAGSTYTMMDCDNDGVLDPVCSDRDGNFGYIGLSSGCKGKWPKEKCNTKKGQVCDRIKGWCKHAGATFFYQDCDGDGIPDPVCADTKGNFGIIKSTENCKSEWPSAVCKTKVGTCKRNKGWCRHAGSTYTLMDCDNDGIPDPVCSDTNGSFGIVHSNNVCKAEWPKASCHTKKGKVCGRPKGWCKHTGSHFMFKDCDGDGIPDPVCTDDKGNMGVIKSASQCKSGWPNDVCR